MRGRRGGAAGATRAGKGGALAHHVFLRPRYGAGKWRIIQKDAMFGAVLATRSNVDLKVREAEGGHEGGGG